ncbi:SPI-1 type III secretion system chaperone SpaK [Obesumbacterium proteus]|uniref:InvB/SpaK family type III secretion system chaperone n=1 Tax=Obesumbacterium proteus TaxID=82983 RepID=UPI00242B6996|nr:SPI-1 type III secretion system chaperone SpaK [Obesumbacterium proteus]
MNTLYISQLTSDALKESGCDPSIIGKLDNHSNIILDLNNLPSIHISIEEGEYVWLWALLGEHSAKIIPQRGNDLLQALMKGCHFSHNSQLQLAIQDDELMLKVLVHPKYLSDGHVFSVALNGFFDELSHFCGAFLR